MDPIGTPLLAALLGTSLQLITKAADDYLKEKLKSLFGWLEKLGEGDKVELGYQDAMELAYSISLEALLQNIKGYGYTDAELKEYRDSVERFIQDALVAEALWNAVREPGSDELAERLRLRWKATGGRELPADTLWNPVAISFRRQAVRQTILSPELRERLNAQSLQELKELIERQGGVRTEVRLDRYAQRMRSKFSPVDLAHLMPAYADDPGRMVLRDVFVAQNVRANPPRLELPKDLAERLREGRVDEPGDEVPEEMDAQQRERLRADYLNQTPGPVLAAIAEPGNRLLVLTGEPGSGKSTLLRYLLTGILEPPADRESGSPLPWTRAFADTFPLLIELRDFHALRRRGECDSFLEYVAYMGKTDQWALTDHAVHRYLEGKPSLVMFDGLDEIFDPADRERVMQEIAGFAQRYPGARIIVTSRPVGYREAVLRGAGFAHYGIQDLDKRQIESFIRGWFALTFPQQQQHAEQRVSRVLESVRQSRSIRLLAGNPMLLTIMALLAREEELPRERAKFYEKAVEVLCHHWDANRNLELPEDRYLNADDKKALLRRVAMRMQAREGGLKGNFIQEEQLEEEIQGFLTDEHWQPNPAEARKAARRMIQQLRERNYILCLRGPHLYGFVHRTFLEYLTAAEYVRRFDKQPQLISFEGLLELFDRHGRDDEWREVLRLICGQIDGQYVGRIVEHLAGRMDLKKPASPPPELPLAIWSLSEVRNLGRLGQAGDTLLAAVVALFRSTRVDANRSFFDGLTSAAGELLQWPGERAIPYREPLPQVGPWHSLYWPRFIAAVLRDRAVTIEMALTAEHDSVRAGALEALAARWPDAETRGLLSERAVRDKAGTPRASALWVLAKHWPDETARRLLAERAVKDKAPYARTVALRALVSHWPDETARRLLTERALKDENGSTRREALAAQVSQWPDEGTRSLLMERTVQDTDLGLRITAIELLVERWPDDTTRSLLIERASPGTELSVRIYAVRALVEQWPEDGTTRRLVTDLARLDGAAASVVGGWHSRFGQILFTRNLDGEAPYLDPADPLSPDRIERAAKKAGLAPEQAEEAVSALSAYLGWEITRGAGRKPDRPVDESSASLDSLRPSRRRRRRE